MQVRGFRVARGSTIKNQSLGNMRVTVDVNICGNCVKIDFYDAAYTAIRV